MLGFAEPGFAIQLISRDELSVVTHWYFYEPDGRVFELLSFNARDVSINRSPADLRSAADAWTDELAPFVNGEGAALGAAEPVV